MSLKRSTVYLVPFLALLFFATCTKNTLTTSKDAHLHYSEDTVFFDTVLTDLTTITEWFVVRNPNNEGIMLESISFADGSQSQYLMSINGESGKELKNIELRGNDSIFVFIQAKLTKNAHDSIQQHIDGLIISYNGNTDRIPIHSWGIDAERQKAQTISQNTIFAANKGYLIIDSLVVAPNVTLTIEAGAKLFFYNRASMIIRGTLIVNGTLENPVLFHSHRLDSAYQQRYGQWGSIFFRAGSRGNKLNYADIMNGTTGISLAADPTGQIDIELTNCKIENMSFAAIRARNAHIVAQNCVFADCYTNVLRLTEGGWYDFKQVTISNYDGGRYRLSTSPSVLATNTGDSSSVISPIQNLTFINCIITGSSQSEIRFLCNKDTAAFIAHLSNCYIQQDSSTINHWIDSAVYRRKQGANKPLFINSVNDFNLDSLSEARNKANIEIARQIPIDKNGNNRLADGKPDLGATEFAARRKD